jgi:hypothetical protein
MRRYFPGYIHLEARLCGLVVRVPGYRFRGPVRKIEELFQGNTSSGLENRN